MGLSPRGTTIFYNLVLWPCGPAETCECKASFSLKVPSVPAEVSGGLVPDKVRGGYDVHRTQQVRSSVACLLLPGAGLVS